LVNPHKMEKWAWISSRPSDW